MTGQDPLAVSCIVPVHNGERFLEEALESILQQTVPPAEVIVVNDGSTDGTGPLLQTYGDRLRVVDQPQAGVAAARNRGISLATSPVLAFLDADDLWAPDKLRRQTLALQQHPDVGFVLSFIENFWDPKLGKVPEAIENHPAARARPGFYFQTMAAHRWVFERVGPLDSSLSIGEDIDWFVRAMEAEVQHHVLGDLLVRRRIHDQNLTGRGGGDPDRFAQILQRSLQRRRRAGTARPSGRR